MSDHNPIEEVSKILGNRTKFKRLLILIGIIAFIICYGFYSHEISKIVVGLVGK